VIDGVEPTAAERAAKRSSLTRLLEVRELVLIIIILLGGFAMCLVSPIFLSAPNILAILLGLSIDALIAAGMTLLLVSGGFDLSVGSTIAFSGIVACIFIKAGIPVALAVVVGICSGMLVGLINGLIVTRWSIHPFIVTLGMLSIVRGFVLILANGVTIVELPRSFTMLGQGKVFGVQFPIILTILVILVGDILLRNARYFRQSYYIGGNEKAAILTGIKVNKVKIVSYVIVGALAAMAGVLTASRLGAASVNIGVGEELKIITACVIGGASLNGGEGSVVGAFLGALLMAMIINSLNLLGIDVYWQNVVTGVILISAVVLDTDLKRRREAVAK
jgi:ribose transport system permease protein